MAPATGMNDSAWDAKEYSVKLQGKEPPKWPTIVVI